MRIINLIMAYCSVIRKNYTLYPQELSLIYHRFGFCETGCHYYIRKDGTMHLTCALGCIGAHAKNSIGICYEGVLNCRGHPADISF